jgi:hypothetical protein
MKLADISGTKKEISPKAKIDGLEADSNRLLA